MTERSDLVLITSVGEAGGARAAAAALACAGSDADGAGLLVELGGRKPRPALFASAAARRLEQRLAGHLPDACVAARGLTCHLSLPADEAGIDRLPAALALVRESLAAVHLPPRLLQAVLAESRLRPSAALLRADPRTDRALTALVARDLIHRGLALAVLKRPLGWVDARRALFGVLTVDSPGGLPRRQVARLLRGRGAPAWTR